ncbi:MAG TPA: phosphate acyltransferase [Gemmatimonadales bacterium]|nr:phosphate acyltransferase [Gemmatimonadales bacterium]
MSFRRELLERAARRKATIVLCEGEDPRVQAAAHKLRSARVVEPIVLGGDGLNPAKDPRLGRIATLLRERRPERIRDGVHALDIAAEPINFGAALVALGEADGCVAGAVCPTGDVIRAALWAIGTAPSVSLVSSSFYMVLNGDLVLTFTDCAVVPEPTPGQLAEIALAAARDRSRLVGDSPRVAFLSYSTKGSAKGPHVARVQEAAAHFQQLAPNIASDGELQADAALSPEICERKAAGSPVTGRANVLVFPDLDSGNISYKLVQRLAGAVAIGPILQGLARPMADLSRGASPDDIVEVAAMVALQSDPTPA